jgi:hypothetical protein
MGKKEDGPYMVKLVLMQLGQGMVGGVVVIFPKQLGIKMGPSCLSKEGDLCFKTEMVLVKGATIVTKFNVIVKIHKYIGLHEKHHFILMVKEVYGVLLCDMVHFINAYFFHNKRLGSHLSLSFCIRFFTQRVDIDFQHVLTFAIKKNIVLMGDACFKPPIFNKSHNLHASDIRKGFG